MKQNLVGLLVLCVGAAFSSAYCQTITYGSVVYLGLYTVKADDDCITFLVNISSDHFFQDLEKTSIDGRSHFTKNGKKIHDFPPHIVLQVSSGLSPCDDWVHEPSAPPNPFLRNPYDKADLMKSLSVVAKWRIGKQERLAKTTLIKVSRPPLQETGNSWNYELEVESRDVPLQSELDLVIMAENGKALGSFNVHL